MEAKLISIREAANFLGVSKDSVRRLVDRGDLKKVKVLRRVLIPVSEVERMSKPAPK
jgi:excisionase family DNA binding protein